LFDDIINAENAKIDEYNSEIDDYKKKLPKSKFMPI
jgi:hypothetical protein